MTETATRARLVRLRPGKFYRDASKYPTLPGPFSDVGHVMLANREGGAFFFEASAMRFFRSRVVHELYAGRVFITSEQFVPTRGEPDARRYSLRMAADDGRIYDVGPFQAYPSLRAARRAARKIERAAGIR